MSSQSGQPDRPPRPIAAAFATACVLALASYLAAWQAFGAVPTYFPQHMQTVAILSGLREHVKRHVQEHGRAPADFEAFVASDTATAAYFDDGKIVDAWGNPFSYVADGATYEITSVGGDGRPGGFGPDADVILSDGRLRMPTLRPTLWQFLFDMPSGGILTVCVLSGALAFVLCVLLPPPPGCRAGTNWTGIAIISVLSLLMALLMSMLHIIPDH